jgi:LacI family transcriptional regulator, repressor for deo operon, udp, cdd, tsx, nupC, and nupG
MVLRSDVAKHACVSLAVVSRVLNKSGYVAQEKRDRVLRAVEELQYHPNPVARSLKSNRTNQILYYIIDLSNNYYMDMYKGMMEYATAAGYNVIISGNLDAEQITKLMVDGVVFPFEDAASVEDLRRIRVPMVAAAYNLYHINVDHSIKVDLAGAVRIALDHLKSLGHDSIGFAAMDISEFDLRLNTFRQEMAGTPDLDSLIFGPGFQDSQAMLRLRETNYFERGILAARQYLAGDRRASAILCFNDDTAMGLLSHLQSAGISIPGDLSVVGIDDHFSSAYTSPPLTTVAIHPVLHGRECVKALIDLIEGREPSALDRIPVDLVVRETTAPKK